LYEFSIRYCLRAGFSKWEPAAKALRSGLHDMISRDYLRIFSFRELSDLFLGQSLLNVPLFRRHVDHMGLSPLDMSVNWFWDIVEKDLDVSQLRQLLRFWSGSSSAPHPSSLMTTGATREGDEDFGWSLSRLLERFEQKGELPQAAVCDRHLMLPEYQSRAELKEKLLLAIEFGSLGYDRS